MKISGQFVKNTVSAIATVGFAVAAVVVTSKVAAIALLAFSVIGVIYLAVSLIQGCLSSRVKKKDPQEIELEKYMKQVIPVQGDSDHLVGCTEAAINKDLGGMILCKSMGEAHNYMGMVLLQEDSAWVLYICTGGGNGELSTEFFEKEMPEVIHKVAPITSNPVVRIQGRHPGNTLRCFQQWQGVEKEKLTPLIEDSN